MSSMKPALHVFSVAAFLLLGLAGCSGRFFVSGTDVCTTPGCACHSDLNCGEGMSCIEGACTEPPRCSPQATDGACPDGRECSIGVCTTSGGWCQGCTSEQACVDGACTDITENAACTPGRPEGLCAVGSTCVSGHCTEINDKNSCSPEHPQGLCQSSASCLDGVCIPTSENPCSAENPDGLCDNGRVCVPPGRCDLPPCSLQAPLGYCPPTQFCSASGSCIPMGSCAVNGDCDTHYTCGDNACVRDLDCSSNADCFSNEHCSVTGFCYPQGRCAQTADCNPDESCSSDGRCIPAGTCSTALDCQPTQFCSSANTCLDTGKCAGLADCAPGYSCDGSGSCVLSGQTCTTNVKDPATCPVGESCCPDGERCSSAGSCIQAGSCVDDNDCIGTYSCVDHVCQPDRFCTSGCQAGEVCSYSGGCIPDGSCVIDGDCPDGEVCTATFECRIGVGCGNSEFAATLVKPNMLVLLDRSGSMNECVSGDVPSKWDEALGAIQRVIGDHSDTIRFGLSTYPHMCSSTNACSGTCDSGYCTNSCNRSNNCQAGEVDVAVGDGSGTAIESSLSGNFPGGYTPTGKTLRTIGATPADYGLPAPGDTVQRANYILLVTDGEPNCDGTNASYKVNSAIATLGALANPIETYVVGFGFSTVSTNLNCNAVYGGTARADCTATKRDCYVDNTDGMERCRCYNNNSGACYYEANNLDTLSAAFNEIAGLVASCSFYLDSVPDNLSQLNVYFDYGGGQDPVRLPRDPTHQDNWDYDGIANQLNFYGNACQTVQDGTATPRVIYVCRDGGG